MLRVKADWPVDSCLLLAPMIEAVLAEVRGLKKVSMLEEPSAQSLVFILVLKRAVLVLVLGWLEARKPVETALES